MEPYQRRVVAEKRELDAKLHKLLEFFTTNSFTDLDPAEKKRLIQQSVVMQRYSDILAERIAAFNNHG